MENPVSISMKKTGICVLPSFLLLLICFNQSTSWLFELPQVFARHQSADLEPTDNNAQSNVTESDSLALETTRDIELAGVYTDPKSGISVGFPAYWQVDDIDQNPDDDIKNIVFFYSPQNDAFIELSTEEAQFPGTADEYLNSVISTYRTTFQDFQLLESNTTGVDVAGQNGYRFVSTYQHNGTNYERMETGTIIDGRPYFIVYDAEKEKYSDYVPLADLVLESLQIPTQDLGTVGEQAVDQVPGGQQQEQTPIQREDGRGRSGLTPDSSSNVGSAINNNTNFLTYENSTIGIRMQYPSDWEIMEFGKSVSFHTPLESDEQVFSESVGILTLEDLPSSAMSVNDYLLKQVNKFINDFPDSRLIEVPTDITIDGNPAKKAVFVLTEDSSEYKNTEIFTTNKELDKAFQIEISVKEGKYPEDPPAHIQKMIDSLEMISVTGEEQQLTSSSSSSFSSLPLSSPPTSSYISEIKLGYYPQKVAVNPDTNKIYIP